MKSLLEAKMCRRPNLKECPWWSCWAEILPHQACQQSTGRKFKFKPPQNEPKVFAYPNRVWKRSKVSYGTFHVVDVSNRSQEAGQMYVIQHVRPVIGHNHKSSRSHGMANVKDLFLACLIHDFLHHRRNVILAHFSPATTKHCIVFFFKLQPQLSSIRHYLNFQKAFSLGRRLQWPLE